MGRGGRVVFYAFALGPDAAVPEEVPARLNDDPGNPSPVGPENVRIADPADSSRIGARGLVSLFRGLGVWDPGQVIGVAPEHRCVRTDHADWQVPAATEACESGLTG